MQVLVQKDAVMRLAGGNVTFEQPWTVNSCPVFSGLTNLSLLSDVRGGCPELALGSATHVMIVGSGSVKIRPSVNVTNGAVLEKVGNGTATFEGLFGNSGSSRLLSGSTVFNSGVSNLICFRRMHPC